MPILSQQWTLISFRFSLPIPSLYFNISWLNLEMGLDVCIFEGMTSSDKAFSQLIFPAYIIILAIIILVVSECSPKFARIIGKGNPVAVLATMILLSYTKFINSTLGLIFLAYFGPAYGSSNGNILFINRDVIRQSNILRVLFFYSCSSSYIFL